MMVSVARKSKIPIAVHLDHGYSLNTIKEAIDYGFTSVMFDGSPYPLEENIRRTRDVRMLASQNHVDLEAEIGIIKGCIESATCTASDMAAEQNVSENAGCANPDDAIELWKKTNCDALAVAIGNAHGHYHGKPHLHFDILKKINAEIPVPLVLHGGTGLSENDFRSSINSGIRKINIATSVFDSFVAGAKKYLDECGDQANYFSMNEELIANVYENVRNYIYIFNNREE